MFNSRQNDRFIGPPSRVAAEFNARLERERSRPMRRVARAACNVGAVGLVVCMAAAFASAALAPASYGFALSVAGMILSGLVHAWGCENGR